MTQSISIRTCLWFDSKGLEAAKFYVSLIPGSELHTVDTRDDEPLLVSFTLGGVPYQILNGGPHYKMNPACSIAVTTPDQDETDRIWDALVAEGGEAGRCGWLVDRWGVSIHPSYCSFSNRGSGFADSTCKALTRNDNS